MTRRVAITSIFLGVLLCCMPGANAARAQTLGGGDVSLTVAPQNPAPGQTVSVSIQSYSVDLKSSFESWTVDGTRTASGYGIVSIAVTAKALGVATRVSVTVSPAGNIPPIVQSATIVPAVVDILWQATDSIVPPLYRGKAMPTSESNISFVAVPNVKSGSGTLVSPASFVYDWSEDYSANDAASGYGKNALVSSMDYLNPMKNIGVTVLTRDGQAAATSQVSVAPSQPKIVWYAASPLYGPLFNHALQGGYTVAGSDISLLAEPYYLSPGDPTSPAITYAWQLNGNALTTPNVPNSIFLHRDTSSKGTASLDINVTNATHLFQAISSHLDLILQ